MGMNCIQNCSVRKGRIERGQMALAHNFGEGSLSAAKQQPRGNVGVVIRRRRESLGAYIARFVREMEQGVRLNQHSLHYSASTVKNYKGFAVQFALYCESRCRSYNFSDIDLSFYDDFVAYFTSKNYSVNTIGRHIKELKIIMRAAREEGLHCNDAASSEC